MRCYDDDNSCCDGWAELEPNSSPKHAAIDRPKRKPYHRPVHQPYN